MEPIATELEETVTAVQLAEEDLIVMAERQDEFVISVLGVVNFLQIITIVFNL